MGRLKRKSRDRTRRRRKTHRRTKAITEDLPAEGTTGIPMEDRLMGEVDRLIGKAMVEDLAHA